LAPTGAHVAVRTSEGVELASPDGRRASKAGFDPESQHRGRTRRVWIITVSAMAISLAATVLVSSLARVSYQQSEQRLTTLQTRLTAQLLSSATLRTSSQLDRVVGLSAESGDPLTTFQVAMAPLMKPKGQFASASLVLVRQSPVVLEHLGSAPLIRPTDNALNALYERAARSPSVVVTRVVSGRLQRFGFLVSARAAGGTYVVGAGSQLPSSRHVTLPANSPDAVLNFALYYGTRPTPSSLIETNAPGLPLTGTVATAVVAFGTAHLTLVASPRVSLAGAWPQDLPWAILAFGIVLAFAVGLFARRLALRRSEAEEGAEVARRLYDEQRSLSTELQVALLPKKLPVIEGVEFSARYLPATSGLEVGGDWYSAISIDSDHFAFVVGDVSGHGLSAASAMAPLRFTVRALAKLGLSPAAILEQADTEIDLMSDGHFATVLVGVVDRIQNTCTLASAGHPLPLVMGSGRCYELDVPVGPPLGLHLTPYTEHSVSLPPGATLVAFTDGLVERRGESIQAHVDRLRRTLAASRPTTAEAAVGLSLKTLEDPEGHEDDIAIIAIKLSAATSPESEDSHELTDADRMIMSPTKSSAISAPEVLS
jgi:serine phosphatase RsbU (regulator of sigma subunit)